MSYATITVTGAVIVFSTLSGASAGRSRSLASFDRRNANRAGEEFALVGAHFSRSYSSRSVSSVTGRGCHVEYVRALRKSASNALSSTVSPMVSYPPLAGASTLRGGRDNISPRARLEYYRHVSACDSHGAPLSPRGREYGPDPDTTEAPGGSPARGANARSGRARALQSCNPRNAPTGVGRPLRLSCAYGRPGDGHRGPRAGCRERRARDDGACRDRRRARAAVQEAGRVRAVRAQREADPA